MQHSQHRKCKPDDVDRLSTDPEGSSACPRFRLNMISIGKLDEKATEGTLYMVHARLCKSEANVVADSSGELWHKRLGHMSEKGMHLLAEQELLPKVKGVHLEKCVDGLVKPIYPS